MAQHAKPLVHVKFDVLLDCRAKEPATPSSTFAVGDWAADRPARAEEEQVDMRVDLRNDGEVDIKVQIQSLDRDIRSQTAVFPLVSEGIWRKSPITLLGHQDNRVQNARDSGRSEQRAPDNSIRSGDVVQQLCGSGSLAVSAPRPDKSIKVYVRMALGRND